jgi:hypothetical protein
MKANCKHVLFFVLVMIVTSHIRVTAQEDSTYYKGYFITPDDTVHCFINKGIKPEGKIKYKLEKDDQNVLKIKSENVLVLSYDTIYFERIFIKNRSFLAERVLSGNVNLYLEYISNINSGSGIFFTGPYMDYSEIYLKKSNLAIQVDKKGYKDNLKMIFKEDTLIVNILDTASYEYVYENIEKFTYQYNKFSRKNHYLPEPIDTSLYKSQYKDYLKNNKGHFGFEVPLMVNYGLIYVTENVDNIKHKNGGFGYDVGFGVNYSNKRDIEFSLGFNKYSRHLNSKYSTSIDYSTISNNAGDTAKQVIINEKGLFNYYGIYLGFKANLSKIFWGFGMNFSVTKNYSSNYDVFDSSNSYLYSKKADNSPLVVNVIKQFDMLLLFGGNIKVNNNLALKPYFQFNIPLSHLVNIGAATLNTYTAEYTQEGIGAYTFNFGLITEFKL